MSEETAEWLNHNILLGFTNQRTPKGQGGELPWHYRANLQDEDPITGHVGNCYPGAIPVDHIQRRLFSWEPESGTITVTLADGTTFVAEGWQAIVRRSTKSMFKSFTTNYQIHAPSEWLLGVLSNITGDTLFPSTAGLLKNGAKAFVSVEVPESITTPEGIVFRPNLTAATSCDGSLATTYLRSIVLPRCDNTLDAALGEGMVFKARHSANSGLRIKDAREALSIVHQSAEEFTADVKKLCEVTVTDKQWSDFLNAHRPVPEEKGAKRTNAAKEQGELTKLWISDERVSPWKNTAYGAWMAVNTFDQHLSVTRGANARVERNMLTLLKGQTGATDKAAMDTLFSVLANA